MAKNREPVKPVQPEPESSEEETDASSDEEEESDPQPITTTKKPLISESSEEESDPEPVNPQLTPAKRSLEDKVKNPEPKKANKKIEPEPEKKKKEAVIDVKKPNKTVDSASESSKKVLFQRFWTEEDEIVILKGMVEYEAENNVNPVANLDDFLDYIKEDLHSVEVTKDQLQNKIRRLKKKFENNKAKKVRNFAKAYEKEAYELSGKIWGSELGKEKVASVANVNVKDKSTGIKGNAVAENGENEGAMEVSSGYGGKKKLVVGKRVGSFDSNVDKLMRIGADLFEGEEGIKGSKEWKKLEREEMELTVKQMDVMRAKMRLVLDSMDTME